MKIKEEEITVISLKSVEMKISSCKNRKKIVLFFHLMAIVAILLNGIISGCSINNGIPITRPDLIPICSSDPANYCDAEIENQLLLVHVKNKGLADAEASHTQVVFYHTTGEDQSQIKPVPPVLAGETHTISFDMTLGSWDPDFNFEITVDVFDEINETNEVNNTVIGFCSSKMLSIEPSL